MHSQPPNRHAINQAWPIATSAAHEHTVQLLSLVFKDVASKNDNGRCTKSDLARSDFGKLLHRDSFLAPAFARWGTAERRDDLSVLCTACKRKLEVGAECGWYHRRGYMDDMCEAHFNRLDPDEAETQQFISVVMQKRSTSNGLLL